MAKTIQLECDLCGTTWTPSEGESATLIRMKDTSTHNLVSADLCEKCRENIRGNSAAILPLLAHIATLDKGLTECVKMTAKNKAGIETPFLFAARPGLFEKDLLDKVFAAYISDRTERLTRICAAIASGKMVPKVDFPVIDFKG